ncbi:unnamed protein product [Amoebophrya sp. A120]|nr:unnamed protein product [Amoebophrya sp. A120]|eukprot:GSA120T00000706001.1
MAAAALERAKEKEAEDSAALAIPAVSPPKPAAGVGAALSNIAQNINNPFGGQKAVNREPNRDPFCQKSPYGALAAFEEWLHSGIRDHGAMNSNGEFDDNILYNLLSSKDVFRQDPNTLRQHQDALVREFATLRLATEWFARCVAAKPKSAASSLLDRLSVLSPDNTRGHQRMKNNSDGAPPGGVPSTSSESSRHRSVVATSAVRALAKFLRPDWWMARKTAFLTEEQAKDEDVSQMTQEEADMRGLLEYRIVRELHKKMLVTSTSATASSTTATSSTEGAAAGASQKEPEKIQLLPEYWSLDDEKSRMQQETDLIEIFENVLRSDFATADAQAESEIFARAASRGPAAPVPDDSQTDTGVSGPATVRCAFSRGTAVRQVRAVMVADLLENFMLMEEHRQVEQTTGKQAVRPSDSGEVEQQQQEPPVTAAAGGTSVGPEQQTRTTGTTAAGLSEQVSAGWIRGAAAKIGFLGAAMNKIRRQGAGPQAIENQPEGETGVKQPKIFSRVVVGRYPALKVVITKKRLVNAQQFAWRAFGWQTVSISEHNDELGVLGDMYFKTFGVGEAQLRGSQEITRLLKKALMLKPDENPEQEVDVDWYDAPHLNGRNKGWEGVSLEDRLLEQIHTVLRDFSYRGLTEGELQTLQWASWARRPGRIVRKINLLPLAAAGEGDDDVDGHDNTSSSGAPPQQPAEETPGASSSSASGSSDAIASAAQEEATRDSSEDATRLEGGASGAGEDAGGLLKSSTATDHRIGDEDEEGGAPVRRGMTAPVQEPAAVESTGNHDWTDFWGGPEDHDEEASIVDEEEPQVDNTANGSLSSASPPGQAAAQREQGEDDDIAAELAEKLARWEAQQQAESLAIDAELARQLASLPKEPDSPGADGSAGSGHDDATVRPAAASSSSGATPLPAAARGAASTPVAVDDVARPVGELQPGIITTPPSSPTPSPSSEEEKTKQGDHKKPPSPRRPNPLDKALRRQNLAAGASPGGEASSNSASSSSSQDAAIWSPQARPTRPRGVPGVPFLQQLKKTRPVKTKKKKK